MARIKVTRKAIRENMIPQTFSEKMRCPQCFHYGAEPLPQPSYKSRYGTPRNDLLIRRKVTKHVRATHVPTCANYGKYWVEACEGSECTPGGNQVIQEACSYCDGNGFVMCEVTFSLAPAEQLAMVS